MSLRARVNRLLAPAEHGDRASALVDRLVFSIVAFDLALFIVAADLPSDMPLEQLGWIYSVEVAIVCLFAVEYLLRLWSCVEDTRYRPPQGSRLRYARTPLALVDLVAALPVLTLLPGSELVVPASLTTVRTVRLVRLLRAVKLVRYSRSLQALGRALKRIDEELIAVLLVMFLIALIGANIAHSFEHEAQPESFGSFASSLWWTVVTMTTVGYGDVVPVTTGGRVLAMLLSVAGLAMFAAPAGLLAAAFGDEMARERRRRERQRDRERREREERVIEHLVEEAVADALRDEQLRSSLAERARDAVAEHARHSARAAFGACPECGQSLHGAAQRPARNRTAADEGPGSDADPSQPPSEEGSHR